MLRPLGLYCAFAALIVTAIAPVGAEQLVRDNRPNKNNDAARSTAVGARALIDRGKYQDAVLELDAAIKLDPHNGFSYALRGQAKNRMGQIDESIADFDQALKLAPRNTLALNIRGYSYFLKKDNGRAFADLNAATEIDPTYAGPYANRGLIYSDMGEQDRALKELNTALKLNSKFGPAYGNLGSVYNKLQQFDQAVSAFDKSIQLVPNAYGNFNGRGVAYFGLGDNDRALADFNESIRLNPKSPRAFINRGRVYLDKAQYKFAVEDFNEALRQDPRNVFALLQRAKAFELLKDYSQARADFQNVMQIIPAQGIAMAGLERIDSKIADTAGVQRPLTSRAGVRIALVVGNSHYAAVDRLANPERDAKMVAGALRQSGFEKVELLIDATRQSLTEALETFSVQTKSADWAVVYYAGHGIEYDGSNFLVPVDVKYVNDEDIPKESVALDRILNAVGGAAKLRLVILDACRENPFVKEMRQSGDTGAIGKGLARIEPESGTLVAFATKHGHFATDGLGRDSPFATALVDRMAIPGLEINQLFRLVHDDVYALTDKEQEPFTYGQLSAQGFYFKGR